jgi:tetratricopeptide (TPR) repeat protein
VKPAPVDPAVLLEAAHAQLTAGCLDCLLAAYAQYQGLRSDPKVGQAATAGVIRSAALIGLREHELGMSGSGHLKIARDVKDATALAAPEPTPIVELVEALVAGPSGRVRSSPIEAQSLALAELSKNQVQWAELLRSRMPGDRVAAYAWLTLACGIYGSAVPDSKEPAKVVADDVRAPLVAFKLATSCGIRERMETLDAAVAVEPRFKEAHFLQGLAALSGQAQRGAPAGPPDLEGADVEFRAAYEWRQDWPALTLAISNLALTFEDFERALEFYDHTLQLMPRYPEALIGRVRSLTYLLRHTQAIWTTDEMLAEGINPGDARYWRALNQEQLSQHDAAWDDIELAGKLLMNGDVPKLAGIIAVNRKQLEVARQQLELALKRFASPCCATGRIPRTWRWSALRASTRKRPACGARSSSFARRRFPPRAATARSPDASSRSPPTP